MKDQMVQANQPFRSVMNESRFYSTCRRLFTSTVLAVAGLGGPDAGAAGASTALSGVSDRYTPARPVSHVAVFAADDRTTLPSRLRNLENYVGMLFEPQSRSVCTAFCVDSDVVATAAHCLFRTRGEKPLPLSRLIFRLSEMGRKTPGTRIAGAATGAAAQHVMTGTTDLSTKPPIDAASDWALVRLQTSACRKGGLPLSRRTPAMLSASVDERPVYQVGYHADFGNWRLSLSPPCSVRRASQNAGGRTIALDFADASTLILHTCDTGGASSGSPLLIDGPRGPEVVGINVGTYLQSRVLKEGDEVLHRYRSSAIANTGVSTLAFLDLKEVFASATMLSKPAEVRRLQSALSSLGHYEGRIDGRYGPALRQAIKAFEAAERRPRTGLASTILLKRLDTMIAGQSVVPSYAPSSESLVTGSVPDKKIAPP